jgi:hypothetical protein
MKCVTKWRKAIFAEKKDKVITWEITKLTFRKTLFAMTIPCYICVKMRFLDRVTYGESIGEKTKSLAPLVR